ncbi:hypothetical protein H2201_006750 [Coniosporium apollinis]|uniref:NACHT domain-containing protein n=1 Tax=Coniosporium apollinis TaxID=61459 RepID=A0ABQ9NKY4_9PEZI|nr:hypothetical protein H2201_006750 [Coniosporium apollinis]
MTTQTQVAVLPNRTHSQSLWVNALNTLDPELKSSIDFRTASKRDVIATVLKTAQEKRDVCLRKRWKLKKPNGQEVILRDVLEKVIGFVDKFVAVGDVAIQYDPAHAALPWAGVRFLLRMAVSEEHVFGGIIESLETVSRLITQYAMFEDLYVSRPSGTRVEVEATLVALYAEILTYLAKAKRYLESSLAFRILKSALDPLDSWKLERITELEDRLSKLAHIVDAEIQQNTNQDVFKIRDLLLAMQDPVRRAADQASVFMRMTEENDFGQLLRWLSPTPFSQHHGRHSEHRIPGTGRWLLNHPRYRDWNDSSSSSVLVLHGIPGCGKTALASAVVDSFISQQSGNSSFIPLAYFYCARTAFEPGRADPDEVLRSIVRQLSTVDVAQRRVCDVVFNEYERRKAAAKVSGFDPPRFKATECMDLILEMTASNPAVVIVDAIDEMSEDRRPDFLNVLNKIVRVSASVVKVLITSRTDSHILALLNGALTLRIESENVKDDIKAFACHRVEAAISNKMLLNGNVPGSLKTDLEDALIAKAGEMFLWVLLQINSLCRKKTEADIREAMRRLSGESLNQLYAQRLTDIVDANNVASDVAMRTFSLLLCAQEPLTPEAMIMAISVGDERLSAEALDTEKLINICFDLVLFDSKLNFFSQP